MNRETVSEGGYSRLGATWPVDVMDLNISSAFNRAPKTQETIIRARKIPCPRADVDALVDKETDTILWHRWVKKIKGKVRGTMGCGNKHIGKALAWQEQKILTPACQLKWVP
jgi:hypothetical protein